MIEVHELTKQFGPNTALDTVSFSVGKGEILGFLGPNGAGKTTTMRILTGYLAPTSGDARIAGIDLFRYPLEARRKIGYLPEAIPLYGDMTVFEYLHYVAALKEVPRRDRNRQVTDVNDDCGLSDVSHRLIGHLSKGYRQRVGIAQALLADPEVLILDEPTEGLDPKQIIEIRNLIQSLGGRRTVILSSHILPEVSMICQRVVIINKGRVVAVDTPDNLNRSLQHNTSVSLEIRGPESDIPAVLEQIPGVLSVHKDPEPSPDNSRVFRVESEESVDIRNRLARTVMENNWELLGLQRAQLSLEDIFVQIVTEEEVRS